MTYTTAKTGAQIDAALAEAHTQLIELPAIINPSLDLDFGQQEYKSYVDHLGLTSWPLVGTGSKITFARSGTGGGTYFDAMGVMQQAGEDEPRIDYDPVTGECLGLLVEEQRTNLLTYSEDFSNEAWVKAHSSIGGDAVVVPDGSSVVCKLIEDSTNEFHRLQRAISLAEDGTDTAVFSVFVKKAERTSVRVRLGRNTAANSVDVDLIDGSIIRTGSSVIDYGVTPLYSDWFRIWVHSDMTNEIGTQYVAISLLDSSNNVNYTGDGTSGLYVWGADLQEDSFPTSYIPTTTAAVTRNADLCSITGSNFSEWFNLSGVTMLWEGVFRQETLGFQWVPAKIGPATDVGFHGFGTQVEANGGIRSVYRDNDELRQSGTLTVTNSGVLKIASTFDVANSRIINAANGVVYSAQSVTGFDMSLFQSLYIGNGLRLSGASATAKTQNTWVKKITIYPRELSSVQLQALTR